MLLKGLVAAAGVLVILHLSMVIAEYGFGRPNFLKLRSLFDLNREQNIPTLFSTVQLILASLFLTLLTADARAARCGDTPYWAGLAVVFLYLAIDEFCELHERLIAPMRGALHVTGALSFAWVIPFGALVIGFAAIYARFWWRLPTNTRLMFAVAGAMYVGGGIGLEMMGSKLFTVYGWHSVQFDLETMFEEGMEMTGVAIFVYALAVRLGDRVPAFSLTLSRHSGNALLHEMMRTKRIAGSAAMETRLHTGKVKRRASG